jgi:hypothetical protein|tara:strand:+ start:839 stop:955 length:117 start_codon:yes stop_codon:yes gene_type:complete
MIKKILNTLDKVIIVLLWIMLLPLVLILNLFIGKKNDN